MEDIKEELEKFREEEGKKKRRKEEWHDETKENIKEDKRKIQNKKIIFY